MAVLSLFARGICWYLEFMGNVFDAIGGIIACLIVAGVLAVLFVGLPLALVIAGFSMLFGS